MTIRPDPTFHATARLAMEAPPENHAYTLMLSPDFSRPDGLAVIALSSDRGGPERIAKFYEEIGVVNLAIHQDPRGELSRAAGILEVIIGCSLVTIVLFFIGYIIMVPAVIVEILVLYRGYEYLSRSKATEPAVAG